MRPYYRWGDPVYNHWMDVNALSIRIDQTHGTVLKEGVDALSHIWHHGSYGYGPPEHPVEFMFSETRPKMWKPK